MGEQKPKSQVLQDVGEATISAIHLSIHAAIGAGSFDQGGSAGAYGISQI